MTTPRLALLAALLSLPTLPPIAWADPGEGAQPGLGTACGASENPHPCRGTIPDTTVGPGKKRTYSGGWIATGTVVVQSGGTVEVLDASISFEGTSGGFVVQEGANLSFRDSTLQESANGSSYRIVAQPTSSFVFTTTTLIGGEGLRVATAAPTISGSTLRDIPLALALVDVNATIHDNVFQNNTVSVNQTGGTPRLERNLFVGGEVCVRDWRTDPTIVSNTFRGCHTGVFHQESESVISGNDFDDDALPPGTAIDVLGGHSPIIEDNLIRHYGTGIRIAGARAYVRNNTIEQSALDGIEVRSNVDVMDIQGNLVRLNGRDGIRLEYVEAVPVFANTVQDNAGAGIRVVASPAAQIHDNTLERNVGGGIVVDDASDGTTLLHNVARANGAAGILVQAENVLVQGGAATGNAGHGLQLDHALDARILDVDATANGGDGVFLGGSDATLEGVNASQNAGNGFTFDPMGPLTLLGPTPLTRVRAIANGGDGLLNVRGNLTTAHLAWWEGNGGAGVDNDDPASVIDARECYWGHPDGPSTALTPGRGDEVEGSVLFVPFLAAAPP